MVNYAQFVGVRCKMSIYFGANGTKSKLLISFDRNVILTWNFQHILIVIVGIWWRHISIIAPQNVIFYFSQIWRAVVPQVFIFMKISWLIYEGGWSFVYSKIKTVFFGFSLLIRRFELFLKRLHRKMFKLLFLRMLLLDLLPKISLEKIFKLWSNFLRIKC